MAHRRIDIPDDVQIINPETEEPVPGSDSRVTFWQFLERVFGNPGWNETVKHSLAMAAIRKAARRARRDNDAAFLVADGDFEILKAFVEGPKYMFPHTGAVVTGFGFAPGFADQILPFQLAIVDAPRDLDGPRAMSDVDTGKPLVEPKADKKNGKRTSPAG